MIKEHDMIQERILELVKYGLTTGLVDPADEVYTVNRLLEVLGVDDIEDETFERQRLSLHGHRKRQRRSLRVYSRI